MRRAEQARSAASRRPLWLAAALALLALLVVVLAVLWLERRPIASHFIDQAFADRGVPARYRIVDLGLGRQRLTDVVIGDPVHPDLVADWVETEVGYGLHGPFLASVRAGKVRLHGRLVDGHVSLGAIDKLLPPPSGKPFALPKLVVDVADVRMLLETPAGAVTLALNGAGRLDDGFAGRLAATASRLEVGGCTLAQPRFAGRVSVSDAQPSLAGPLRLTRVACGDTAVNAVRAEIDATLGAALDRWRGTLRMVTGVARLSAALGWRAGRGTADFAGTASDTHGTISFTAIDPAAPQGSAAQVNVAGRYRLGRANGFDGRVAARGAMLSPSLLASATRLRGAAGGTPAGPLLDALATAVTAAGRQFDAAAELAASPARIAIGRAHLSAASGARAAFTGEEAGWSRAAGFRLNGLLDMSGGGLPSITATLVQPRAGVPIRGEARVQRYAAGGAELVLSPMSFSATPAGSVRISTSARVSGPLSDGRIEGLTLPLDLRWANGRFLVNPGCFRASFQRVAVGGLALQPASTAMCPVGAALVSVDHGAPAGGARLGATRLAGRLGSTPIELAAAGGRVTLAERGFAIEGLRARLGAPGRVTRLDVATLSGGVAPGGMAGRFADAAGQIGNVPLLLSDAAGSWRLAGGALTVDGALVVADAAAAARFQPLAARGVHLALRNGAIAAGGTLVEPSSGIKIADVRLDHRLTEGRGQAAIAMPGVTFTRDFQPDRLTRLTFGVIADVRGTVSGDARIAWSPAGVSSTGTFSTAGTDLAAAFGPVTGLSTTIHLTDLLNLESAPGQVATVASINPGIAVTDGRIVYQLFPGTRVLVNGARWPFAGGMLTLDPTLLDFSSPQERRLTFHVEGMAADRFLQQFDFKNINATGIFDGVLPMVFDANGGRIEGGRLTARPGGGSIAYVGDLTQKDLGFWGNLAFRSLRSLRYRNLDIRMNGPLAGEMITDVRFAGISQGEGAQSNFLIRRLQKLPFVFNIRIKAPFRGLIDSAQSFYDPRRLIQRNLPALLQEQNRRAVPPIQPPASETMP